MKVRLIKNSEVIGDAYKFNRSSVNEAIVCYSDGSIDSEFISSLEVMIGKEWINMSKALKTHELITDNYNIEFFVPVNEEEKKRGYRLTERDLMELKAQSFD